MQLIKSDLSNPTNLSTLTWANKTLLPRKSVAKIFNKLRAYLWFRLYVMDNKIYDVWLTECDSCWKLYKCLHHTDILPISVWCKQVIKYWK